MDKCVVCQKSIPEYLKVCSRNCSGKLGGIVKNPNKGFGSRKDLAILGGIKSKRKSEKASKMH